MPTFHIETEEKISFEKTYMYKTYFNKNQLFKQLETYYKEDKYRFEIPHKDLGNVRQLLDEYYYELSVTDTPEDYSVVISKETDSRDILKNSAMRKHRGQHKILIKKMNYQKRGQ